jgi:hypothetical protein
MNENSRFLAPVRKTAGLGMTSAQFVAQVAAAPAQTAMRKKAAET